MRRILLLFTASLFMAPTILAAILVVSGNVSQWPQDLYSEGYSEEAAIVAPLIEFHNNKANHGLLGAAGVLALTLLIAVASSRAPSSPIRKPSSSPTRTDSARETAPSIAASQQRRDKK